MKIKCPACSSTLIKKNGHIHNGKQNHRCLSCDRQFVLKPTQKRIDQSVKDLIRKSLLERVSLEGLCRIFNVSMPWLLDFITSLIKELPDDLNADVFKEDDNIEVVILEADELWSYVQKKKNPQWLWLVMHSKTRQILAMEVGARDGKTAEKLFAKLPESVKKKPSTTLICSLDTMKPLNIQDTNQLEKAQVKRLTLKDLTVPLDKDAQG